MVDMTFYKNFRVLALHGRHDRYRFSRTRVYTVDAGRVVPSTTPPLSICVKRMRREDIESRLRRCRCVDVDYLSPEIRNLIDYVDSSLRHICFDFYF